MKLFTLLTFIFIIQDNLCLGIPQRNSLHFQGRSSKKTLESFEISQSSKNGTDKQIINVYDFGAVGDGITDDTSAFQNALNFLSKGGIVYAPRGQFFFSGTLVIPKGVTLEGTYRCVPSHTIGQNNDKPNFGTVLLPTSGSGNETGTPFITLSEDSTLQGVTIYYPNQVTKGFPTAYPWTIDMTGTNPAIIDVECLNCYNAIRAVGAPRHYIARVQGQPLLTGVFIDETYDIGRVEDVHFNPWYSVDATLFGWQLTYGRAFVVARSDWEYFLNTFAFGYAIGYHFISSSTGSCNGNFLGIGADMMANASVQVDAADPWGILITNGEFTSFVDPHFGNDKANPTQVVVSKTNTGAVRFMNSAFWGPSNQIAIIEGSGSAGFIGCLFNYWDPKNKGNYAIQALGSGNLIVQGCEFQNKGNQIYVAKSIQRASIVGNIIMGPEKIHNDGSPSFQSGLNAAL